MMVFKHKHGARAPRGWEPQKINRSAGFTLVELLVAKAILAALAAMTLQGLGALIDSAQTAKSASDATLALDATLRQLSSDLDETGGSPTGWGAGAPNLPGMRWDGKALTLAYLDPKDPTSWRVVAWMARPSAAQGSSVLIRRSSLAISTPQAAMAAVGDIDAWIQSESSGAAPQVAKESYAAEQPFIAIKKLSATLGPARASWLGAQTQNASNDMERSPFRSDAWLSPPSSRASLSIELDEQARGLKGSISLSWTSPAQAGGFP